MTPGRLRVYENRYSFTTTIEKSDYDTFVRICHKRGVSAASMFGEWVKHFNKENMGTLTDNCDMTDFILAGQQKELAEKRAAIPTKSGLPEFDAPIAEWVKYARTIQDPAKLSQSKYAAEK